MFDQVIVHLLFNLYYKIVVSEWVGGGVNRSDGLSVSVCVLLYMSLCLCPSTNHKVNI